MTKAAKIHKFMSKQNTMNLYRAKNNLAKITSLAIYCRLYWAIALKIYTGEKFPESQEESFTKTDIRERLY